MAHSPELDLSPTQKEASAGREALRMDHRLPKGPFLAAKRPPAPVTDDRASLSSDPVESVTSPDRRRGNHDKEESMTRARNFLLLLALAALAVTPGFGQAAAPS